MKLSENQLVIFSLSDILQETLFLLTRYILDKLPNVRERETERERQTDRETETETDRETHRETQRETGKVR